jgi:hypothetical protein
MEYQNTYDVLYETLSCTFPKVIIDNIIFKYLVNSNKYEYKYTIQCDKDIDDIHFNKQYGIICMEDSNSFRFIDYYNGTDHDNSVINTIPFCSRPTESILYVSDDTMLIYKRWTGLARYILKNKEYIRTHFNNDNEYFNNANKCYHMCVCDEKIYRLIFVRGQYNVVVYNLHNLEKIRVLELFNSYSISSKISAHDDKIYVNEYTNKSLICHVHDINNGMRVHQYNHTTECYYSITQIYKNKLYQYESQQIFVYDVLTNERIYSFHVNQCLDEKYNLFISNGILALSGMKHVIFYSIK